MSLTGHTPVVVTRRLLPQGRRSPHPSMEPSASSHPGDEGPGSSSCAALRLGTCRPEVPLVPSKPSACQGNRE